ncbi:uncharacterized protein LOC124173948 [Ischnura elegans]|uniref:uncharacterized protein LOC124173948 n=1 Tax=Ischnura elegans TaxID=197161 RepID=UPI001ED8A5CD|nr:uncharacterized protein LOC124173948 [Ischnura elegans]
MRQRVKKYIVACIECAHHKRTGGMKEGTLHTTERVATPFHTVHVDHLGPFQRSKRDHEYVLAYQDNFTKFIVLRAVRKTKTKQVCEALKDIVSLFGCPERLVSDRGTAFTAKEFEEFCGKNQIKHIKNATATPKANGQVERIVTVRRKGEGQVREEALARIGVVQWRYKKRYEACHKPPLNAEEEDDGKVVNPSTLTVWQRTEGGPGVRRGRLSRHQAACPPRGNAAPCRSKGELYRGGSRGHDEGSRRGARGGVESRESREKQWECWSSRGLLKSYLYKCVTNKVTSK